eukprot:scaffold5150_cov19-Tisochrysis_lutea.AAC.3
MVAGEDEVAEEDKEEMEAEAPPESKTTEEAAPVNAKEEPSLAQPPGRRSRTHACMHMCMHVCVLCGAATRWTYTGTNGKPATIPTLPSSAVMHCISVSGRGWLNPFSTSLVTKNAACN